MKILFDHQIYGSQKYGGVSRYFYELTKGLAHLGNTCINSIYFSENEFTKQRSHYTSKEFLPMQFRGREALKKSINQFVSKGLIKKGGYDIFHPTYYDTYYLNLIKAKTPLIITFHDLIHEKFSSKFPNFLTGIDEVIETRNKLLTAATKIIAVSENTKHDIMEYYGTSEAKIEVIHLASSLPNTNLNVNGEYGDYILFVGNRDAYKNFAGYVTAIAPFLSDKPHLKLICAGGGKFLKSEKSLFLDLKIDKQVSFVSITNNNLPQLYYNAKIFAFPSLYEGFGIPILEAMGCSCPSLLSNSGSLPEVGGDAAMYMDPEDQEDMLAKTVELYQNEKLRTEMKTLGKERASKFTWETTVSQTLNLYQSLL